MADILEGLGGGFALWGKDLKLILCNDAYRNLYLSEYAEIQPGKSVAAIARTQAARIVGPKKKSMSAWVADQQKLRRRKSYEDEVQLSDGRWLSISGNKIPGGFVTELVTDITDIKEGEIASTRLAQRNAQMAVAISSMQSGVIVSNPNLPDNPVVYANPAFEPPASVSPKDVLGTPLASLFRDVADEKSFSELNSAVKNAKSARLILSRPHPGADTTWSELRLNPVFGANKRVNYFIGIETDITAQKRAELDLESRVERQAAVADLGNKALAGEDLEVLFRNTVDIVSSILGFQIVSVRELTGPKNELTLRASRGWTKKELETLGHVRTATPLGAKVLKSGKASYVNRTGKSQAGDLKTKKKLLFSAAARISGRSAPFGLIGIHDTKTHEFSPDDLSFLDSIAYVLGVAVERHQSEEELRRSQHRFELAVKGSNDGIWDWDLATGKLYLSQRWKAMLGLYDDEMANEYEAWVERIHQEDRVAFDTALQAHLNDKTQYFACEHRLLHEDGSYRWMLARGLAVRDSKGNATRIAGSLSDVTEAKRAETELLKDALHDTLTGLPNRALFNDRLTQSLVRVNRDGNYLFAVLYLDFDRFKVINDSLGHSYGDQILIEIGHRLKVCTRDVDTVARLGGDEFAIVLENLDSEEKAEDVARRINVTLAEPFDLAGRKIVSNASIGIAFSSLGYHDPEEMVRDADIAMYQAKTQGRGRHVVFEKGMHLRAMSQLEMETDLRRAIENNEFTLAFQPVVDMKTHRTAGFEALVRWNHPERGFVPPGDFIPIAEETKLIIPMGRLILTMACQQMKRWKDRFPKRDLSMSINISPEQFADPDLIDDVGNALKDNKLDGQDIKVEITEGAIMENPHEVTNRLLQLRKMGVQLHVDDFGTGYSSLSHLHRFPINALKVDRSFVISMAESEDNMEIVRTIIDLAHNLKLHTVAEGVETKKDLAQLKKLNCDYAQGFYFSKPMDARKATAYIRAEK